MDYLLLYFILRLDYISSVGILFAWVTGIFFVAALVIFILNPDDRSARDVAKPWTKRFGISFAIVLFFAVMVPDTKQAAAIYCLPKIVNNDQVQKMPNNLLRLANQWIDEQLDEAVETVTETIGE